MERVIIVGAFKNIEIYHFVKNGNFKWIYEITLNLGDKFDPVTFYKDDIFVAGQLWLRRLFELTNNSKLSEIIGETCKVMFDDGILRAIGKMKEEAWLEIYPWETEMPLDIVKRPIRFKKYVEIKA